MGGGNWLDFSVGVGIDLVLCGSPKWLVLGVCSETYSVFASGHRNQLDIRVGIEIDFISVMGRNELCFCVRDRNWLGFSVCIEIDLVLVRGSKLTLFLCGLEITWFWWIDRNWLGFERGDRSWLDICVLAENHYFVVWGSIDLVLLGSVENDPKLTCFCMQAEIYLVLVWALALAWFLWRWAKFAWVQWKGSNLTWFQCTDEIDLVVMWVGYIGFTSA